MSLFLKVRASLIAAATMLSVVVSAGLPAVAAEEGKMLVFFGTYTGGDDQGVFVYELDLKSGALTKLGASGGVKNPSFVELHPTADFLYAASEVASHEGKKSGAIAAFAFDRATGKMTKLNEQPSVGAGPCHVTVDATGQCVMAANYGGGSIVSLPINDDGSLGEPVSFFQHEGHGGTPRQKGPHAHSINVDGTNTFAMAADLGLDKVLIYRLDPAKAKLTPNDPAFVKTAPGAGPRHFAFHPSNKFAYVINEIDNTVTAFAFDAKSGELTTLQSITTLPADYTETSHTAEIRVHPSGKFLYGSNRGHDSLAIFTIDEATGKLTAAGHQSTMGSAPRNFNIDPTGQLLLVANQRTNNVVVFRIDQKTGQLTPTGVDIEVPSPVCVRFRPRK
ncbi:lactonase family protein [Lignipirellula cremea]|uniref:6-phosphogluconolactonase n=1 Tax=Lignipirellula cremea TaxID=2528010 RepID=A0A518DPV9_9BACT|nr:lactonase family protein [Lignipirellula cremea]QDU93868.1 6-phosphogluconolactonase [Lignipirellula cremea]